MIFHRQSNWIAFHFFFFVLNIFIFISGNKITLIVIMVRNGKCPMICFDVQTLVWDFFYWLQNHFQDDVDLHWLQESFFRMASLILIVFAKVSLWTSMMVLLILTMIKPFSYMVFSRTFGKGNYGGFVFTNFFFFFEKVICKISSGMMFSRNFFFELM